MSLFSSGDRVFERSWTCCFLVLLFAGCNTAPEVIEPPSFEDDFGASFDAEPITEESVAEMTMMHQRAQIELELAAVIPIESKVDQDVLVGGKLNYEVFKNLFMGLSFSYANLEINDGAGDSLNSNLDSLEGIQIFDNYDQWNIFIHSDYDLPLTRPSAEFGSLTLRFGLGAGLVVIDGDEDSFLESQFTQAGSSFRIQPLAAFVLRPAAQLRLRVWDHGLAFLGVSYDWVPENRIDVKLSGERREIDDDIEFDAVNIGGGFSFEW